MPSCFVKGCKSLWKKKGEDVRMHIFPRDMNRIKTWLLILKVNEKEVEDLTTRIFSDRQGAYRICSKHFTSQSYEKRGLYLHLTKEAVPSLNLEEEQFSTHNYAKRMRTEETEWGTSSWLPSTHHTITPSRGSIQVDHSSSLSKSFVHTHGAEERSSEFTVLTEMESESIQFLGNEIEVVYESAAATTSLAPEILLTKRISKKKPVKNTRSIGISAYAHIEHINKSTQSDKRRGVEDKKCGANRRPTHRSVAIQCSLMKSPLCEKSVEEITIQESPEHSSAGGLSPRDDTSVESFSPMDQSELNNMKYKRQPVVSGVNLISPGLSSFNYNAVKDPVLEIESIGKIHTIFDQQTKMNESYRPIEQEEARYQKVRFGNEATEMNPRNLDMSLIYMPPAKNNGNHIEENKFIVFESCMDQLLFSAACQCSTKCNGKINKIKRYRIGSAITVSAKCTNGHAFYLWRSQPLINHIPVGNILISAAILCSGLHFMKIDSFFRFLGVFSIRNTTHYANQMTFLFPTINYHWQMERSKILESVKSEPVILAGDGQFDSLGHNRKYCTYSLMEYNSKKIVDFQTLQLQPEFSAMTLEEKAFQIALNRLRTERVEIQVLCTDIHAGIRTLLQQSYCDIWHEYNVWHLAKAIGNKLMIASKKSSCRDLAKWVLPAKSHLWWSASTCDQSPQLLQEKWSSIIYHTTNTHEWEEGQMYRNCFHLDFNFEEKIKHDWLVNGSVAHSKLNDIVLHSRLLKDLKHLSHFCNTGELEVFHNTALKYHCKENHYFNELVASKQLAILDHNFNVYRMQTLCKRLTNNQQAGDSQRNHHRDSNTNKELLAEKIYKPTNQDFAKVILEDVLDLVAGKKRFPSRKQEIPPIIPPVPCPVKEDLSHKICFSL
ncbi:uncharacterized protein [Hyperolius riggenbachi]|uniref:uncharacterized protein n=1 Tax=Hyperolius riggenbachi TaxID=752182 RepID=UPI0035A35337